ncbi:MAG: N-acetyl sugar amidotransferase, partial [Clostridia bacterium]
MNRTCTHCVMDETDPALTFDENGSCSCCHQYEQQRALRGYRAGQSEKELEALVAKIKQDNKDKPYDCVLGISGGVDSAFMALT